MGRKWVWSVFWDGMGDAGLRVLFGDTRGEKKYSTTTTETGHRLGVCFGGSGGNLCIIQSKLVSPLARDLEIFAAARMVGAHQGVGV